MIEKLDKWHKTIIGLIVFLGLELGLTYIFASLAIDTGNLGYYILALIFLFGTLKNLTNLIGKLFHGNHKTSRT
ncbi:MAG: hypothetical protein NVS1B10_03360 [Candidatus Saccharimonadales bacterium]